MKTTSLKTSQAIKELGVEKEHHWIWWANENKTTGYLATEEHSINENIPAYTLSDLPSVLQAVGEKLDWSDKQSFLFLGLYNRNFRPEPDESPLDEIATRDTEIEPWLYHFLHICELHARGEDWDEVLYELVTRR